MSTNRISFINRLKATRVNAFVLRLLLVSALSILFFPTVTAQPNWNKLDVYRMGKLPAHDRVQPEGMWRMKLDGTWAFRYYNSPNEASINPDHWDSIRVPGNIELQGYGIPVYVNMRNEFPSNPPYAPTDFNPTGVYACNFIVPNSWQERRTIVKFGAVKSAMYLYINGQEVGYSEDSKTPAEFDITRFLRPGGKNRMAVKVMRWCNGSYLECQDMWRMSGITRGVEIYSVPQTYITDVKIVADLDTNDWNTGMLSVEVQINREVEGGRLELELDGIPVAKNISGGSNRVAFSAMRGQVEPWSDSTPNLYPLAIRLFDPDGNEVEQIVKRIGFRHIDIVGGQLRLNGRPMEIRGVNRHEHSMYGGHYITPDEMRQDIALMKELGINAVRTSHYPDDELWYDLCDEAGIYVWDEANVESHAQGYGENSLAKKPEWQEPIWDRINNMYLRDRNHPCVIAWSLGNECGNGICFEEAYRRIKALDPTRPVVYERAELEANTDIVSIMYPSVQYLSQYARNPRNTRPYIIAEYCHAMGNSMGGLKDYWDTIDKYPILQGGFIWDWVDQAFKLKPTCWAVGGDLGYMPGIDDDDDFCANGILAADRTFHPHAYEVQAVYTRGRYNVNTRTAALHPWLAVPATDFSIQRNSQAVSIVGRNFSVSVSTADGSITSYRVAGRELLATPLRYNFWRPPTENDLADRNGSRAWQGLDHLTAKVQSISTTTDDGTEAPRIDMLIRLSTPDGSTLRLRQVIVADDSGRLHLNYLLDPEDHFRTLPKVGIQFGLADDFTGCSFLGNIFETYPDRRAAQRVSTWYKSLDELAAPQYVVPQEQGNREAAWVQFRGNDVNLKVMSGTVGVPLNFSVRRYNDSLLTVSRRWCNARPDPYYTVSIDHLQAGLGTATCGPGVAPRYTIPGDSLYRYSFVLSPFDDGLFHNFMPQQLELPGGKSTAGATAVKAIVASREPARQYSGGWPHLLADGRRGVAGDYSTGWAGFDSPDTVELVLMLPDEQRLDEIAVGTCHNPDSWVMAPQEVSAQWSTDGRRWSRWQPLASEQSANLDRHSNVRIVYNLDAKRHKARYVRLRFVCNPTLPDWHTYAAQPAWLMVDEVSIR